MSAEWESFANSFPSKIRMATALLPPIGRGLVCVRVFDAPLRIFASAFFPYERKDAVRRLFEYQANSCGGLSESAEVRSLSEFPEEEEV